MTSHQLRACLAIPIYLVACALLIVAVPPLVVSMAALRLALAVHGRAAPPDLFRSWPFSGWPVVRPTTPPRKERSHAR